MSEYRVASRYAKSLIELSKEKGVLEQVKNDITLFKNTADGSHELAVMLKSPVVSHLKKGTILKALFAGKVTELTLAFFDLICRKNREAVLQAVAIEFLKQYDIVKGIQKATLITSAEISDDVRVAFEKEISKMVAGKEVSLTTKVDESLIGGYVLQIGDKQIDDSVKGRLDRLRADLI